MIPTILAAAVALLLSAPVPTQAAGEPASPPSKATAAATSTDACPQAMPIAVEQKLLPVLDALNNAARKKDLWDKGYERAFQALLDAKDRASKQARVALMDYYIGEAYGEELVCAVALDGNKADLKLYNRCDIPPSHSPVPRNHSLPLRDFALQKLEEGHVKESCIYD